MDRNSFQKEAWNRILQVEYTKWLDNLNSIAPNSESGGRLVLYRFYKLEPAPEEYVTRPTSWRRRRTIAQLRCGCLPLEMEIGRYRHPKTPLAQRICQLCNEGIEDETHFLIFCPQLTQERIALFKTMEGVLGSTFYSLPPAEKILKILMNCGRDLELGKALHVMAQSRKNIISP